MHGISPLSRRARRAARHLADEISALLVLGIALAALAGCSESPVTPAAREAFRIFGRVATSGDTIRFVLEVDPSGSAVFSRAPTPTQDPLFVDDRAYTVDSLDLDADSVAFLLTESSVPDSAARVLEWEGVRDEGRFRGMARVRSDSAGGGYPWDGAVCVAGSVGDSARGGPNEPPALMRVALPDYPEAARLAGIEGTVVVRVLVGECGDAARVEVAQSVHPLLDSAAVAAAELFLFYPAVEDSVFVSAWVAIPLRFTIDTPARRAPLDRAVPPEVPARFMLPRAVLWAR